MYYIVDDDEDSRFDDIDSLSEYLFDPDSYDDDDSLDEWIDEIYPSCEIAGETFYASQIVKECSYSTYNDLRCDWQRSQSESDADYYYSELEALAPGEDTWIRNYKVACCGDVEEEDEEYDAIEAFNAIIKVSYSVKTLSDSPTNVQVIK